MGDYDLLLWAQHTLPAGDSQFFLNHFFRTDSGGNHAGLASSTVDGLLDELSLAHAGADRETATVAVHDAIRDEVPVSILMTPAWHVGVGPRLYQYEPWGSDYYVIHSDFALSDMVINTNMQATIKSTEMQTSTMESTSTAPAMATSITATSTMGTTNAPAVAPAATEDVSRALYAQYVPALLCPFVFFLMSTLG